LSGINQVTGQSEMLLTCPNDLRVIRVKHDGLSLKIIKKRFSGWGCKTNHDENIVIAQKQTDILSLTQFYKICNFYANQSGEQNRNVS